MGRTKFTVDSAFRFDMGYYSKSRRHQVRIIKRSTHHSLRIHNKFADELGFLQLKHYTKRKHYHVFDPEIRIYGKSLDQYNYLLFKKEDKMEDSMRKRLQEALRHLRRNDSEDACIYRKSTIRKSGKNISDVLVVAHKKLKRRGNLLPFCGHRQRKTLYKRELAYWL